MVEHNHSNLIMLIFLRCVGCISCYYL